MLELSKGSDGESCERCLMMKMFVDSSESLMNLLDSMKKLKGRMGGPLLVSYVFPLKENNLPVNLREGAGCQRLGVIPSSI